METRALYKSFKVIYPSDIDHVHDKSAKIDG